MDIQDVGRLDYGGRVDRIETLGQYSSLDASLLFQLAGNHLPVVADNDYYLYRVTYSTAGVDGQPTPVSGLMAVPTTKRIKGIVSWQHGTTTFRPNSISKPTLLEGLGTSGVFAGNGYIMVAADYIGLGVSTVPHPYYHWPSTVSTVVDLISIAEVVLSELAETPDFDLYVVGFSQGGGATAAVQASLQADNPTHLRLSGAATIGAAFNPKDISLPHAIAEGDTFHFALMATAFSQVYGESLEGFIQEPYATVLPEWLDGTFGPEFLRENLPGDIADLVTAEFLSDYEAGIENPKWFYDALQAAATYDYAPNAPLRIYFGADDDVVIPEEGRSAFEHMKTIGGNVELVELGPYTHDQIVLKSLPLIQQWLDHLEASTR